MSQTSYLSQFAGPYQGLLADLSYLQDAISKRNTDAIELPFGVMLAQDAVNDDGVKLIAAAADKLAGLGVFTFARDPNNILSATGGVKVGNQLAVLRRGRIWVPVDQDVTPVDPVYARFALTSGGGGAGAIGTFRKDSDLTGVAGAATAVLVKGAAWVAKGTAAAGLALLEFDLLAART